MNEIIPPKPSIDSQPTLPGYSSEALNLLPQLRNRIAERAARDNISDEEALKQLTVEDIKEAAEDRAKNHAP